MFCIPEFVYEHLSDIVVRPPTDVSVEKVKPEVLLVFNLSQGQILQESVIVVVAGVLEFRLRLVDNALQDDEHELDDDIFFSVFYYVKKIIFIYFQIIFSLKIVPLK